MPNDEHVTLMRDNQGKETNKKQLARCLHTSLDNIKFAWMKWPRCVQIRVSKDTGHEILDFEANAQCTPSKLLHLKIQPLLLYRNYF